MSVTYMFARINMCERIAYTNVCINVWANAFASKQKIMRTNYVSNEN